LYSVIYATFRSSTGGVSALGRTNLHFVDPGVKVNGQYYQDILLTRDLPPDIKQYSNYFTFQQDGAPAHRARETVELLKVETPDFIPPNLWPPKSPDLNPVDYKIWSLLQERVYKTSIKRKKGKKCIYIAPLL